ncbi:universal stress protein [Nocardia mexicana]|uniref:Universal stress protein family protein n=1 Tax=Nocardia mexicana TaxID=279262 RepID=A0A370HDY0_9NOCA|nr:universal stress protein [Nocardia mexicana]RDI55222.1 universal stress protein family protein [Nocardia mexicana]
MTTIAVRPSERALEVARALTDIAGAAVRTEPGDASDDEYLRALSAPDVALGVIAVDGSGWDIVRRSGKPVVLVSERVCPGRAIKRVLVPLDGTDESAHAVAESVRLFRAVGAEIIVLHVFDAGTVPGYWDQAAHAREAWEHEFLARYCTPHFPGPAPALTLRTGQPGENVVDVAAEHADMIILGWSQNLESGRARTVRKTVAEAAVPVMLVPQARGLRPSPPLDASSA